MIHSSTAPFNSGIAEQRKIPMLRKERRLRSSRFLKHRVSRSRTVQGISTMTEDSKMNLWIDSILKSPNSRCLRCALGHSAALSRRGPPHQRSKHHQLCRARPLMALRRASMLLRIQGRQSRPKALCVIFFLASPATAKVSKMSTI